MFKQKVHPLLITFIIILVIGIFTLYLYALKPSPVTTSNSKIIGGNRDSHGCLSGAGYSWCSAANKCIRVWEEPCEDRIFENFKNIEKVLKQNFSKVENIEMNWLAGSGATPSKLKISGYEISANNINQEDIQKIEDYFHKNNFTDSPLNSSEKASAYYHDKFGLSCILNKVDSSKENNIKIDCGLLNKEELEAISRNNELKKIIIEKLSLKSSGINLKIEKFSNTNLRGDYSITNYNLSGSEQKTITSEPTIFLAKKIDDTWEIIYWGDEDLKCNLIEQGFTAEMLDGCIK